MCDLSVCESSIVVRSFRVKEEGRYGVLGSTWVVEAVVNEKERRVLEVRVDGKVIDAQTLRVVKAVLAKLREEGYEL